jgi:hypothetical protein
MALVLELLLVNGDRRTVALPDYTGSLANALGRLDDWIQTEDGGWVQKSFVVEVKVVNQRRGVPAGSEEESERLDDAAGKLVDQGGA